MNENLNNDLQCLEQLINQTAKQGIDFLNAVSERPTSSKADVQLAETLTDKGFGAQDALKLFNQKFEKIIVGSTGPRYWGFVTGGATPAAIVGDMLATFYDQNTQATTGHGDISALIELETIKLLLDLFDLPKNFFGGFVTGATMSNFTCLGVARQWTGRQQNIDIAKEGITKDIKILSAMPHSSIIKSLSMLGIGSNNIQKIKVLENNREAIDIEDLKNKITQLNNAPFILIASAGTVNTADFDDFEEIKKLKSNHNFWLHIDGAFGAYAACSPTHKHLLKGWEAADSITIDCHKWLNVPYESAFFLIKKEHEILQAETYQNSNAPYLGNAFDDFNYLNFLPENSRRLRALPAWFTLNAYGKKGYQDIIENSIEMANLFGQYIEKNNSLKLLSPVRLNNVCFTLKDKEKQNDVRNFLSSINHSGKVFMTPTVYNGQKGIRASFVNWRTTKKDIELVVEVIEKILIEMNIG